MASTRYPPDLPDDSEATLVKDLKRRAEEELERPHKRHRGTPAVRFVDIPRWDPRRNKVVLTTTRLAVTPERQEVSKLEKLRLLHDTYHSKWYEVGMSVDTPDETAAVLQASSLIWSDVLKQFDPEKALRIQEALADFFRHGWNTPYENWFIAVYFYMDVEHTDLMSSIANPHTNDPYTTTWAERHREARTGTRPPTLDQ